MSGWYKVRVVYDGYDYDGGQSNDEGQARKMAQEFSDENALHGGRARIHIECPDGRRIDGPQFTGHGASQPQAAPRHASGGPEELDNPTDRKGGFKYI